MIAYHYPPTCGSSGLQRTLKFSRYLLDHGWQPIVLSVHPRAYQQTAEDQLSDIPSQVIVHRTFALDASRHLSVGGRYPRFVATPDRWSSWWWSAVPVGWWLIKRYRPKVIWSTYPIATAHKIGSTLHRLSGLPWIADCRDSMTEDDYPSDPLVRKAFLRIERRMVENASKVVFTTAGTQAMYAQRYPRLPSARWEVIANGYDEENFLQASRIKPASSDNKGITLVHSGILYPEERDPRAFFAAVAELVSEGRIQGGDLTIILRATGHDQYHGEILRKYGLEDIVVLRPALPYKEALAEMLSADGLLVFQAANCNHQIPAKVYEYLRAQRPILALTDPEGDTARLLQQFGVSHIARLPDIDDIREKLVAFLEAVQSGSAVVPALEKVQEYSRASGAEKLSYLLADCVN